MNKFILKKISIRYGYYVMIDKLDTIIIADPEYIWPPITGPVLIFMKY